MTSPVFVFGSNLAGRHGKGAARFALINHGAIYGVGEGRQGNSYGIPTKDERLRVIGLHEIGEHVRHFLEHARARPDDAFEVTAVGCGLAGYRPEGIAPFFADAPPNCQLPPEFIAIINERKAFNG